ncbi:MAG TPA: GNAT family N-acetyltransferase [Kutzneria sp.]|jgi:ribosomal protein S18 acetylase RimI-like enzyme
MSRVWQIRAYEPSDEELWLRCRVLSFLHTGYYDDVLVTKPHYDQPAVELVAVVDGLVVGVLDAAVRDDLATIETIAVHPDHQAMGIATGLLNHALPQLRDLGGTELDAWTREDRPALRWYAGQGFVETEKYVHVYLSGEETAKAVRHTQGFAVVGAFLHAATDSEPELRAQFERVYVCRRMFRSL